MLISCPFCKNSKAKIKFKSSEFSVCVCSFCQIGYLFPMPTSEKIKNFYNKDYFSKSQNVVCGYRNYISMDNVLAKEATRKIKYIKKFTSKNKLLDIGCGLGVFLKIAKSSGFNVSGNDISLYARKHLTVEKIPLYQGSITENVLPLDFFDIVTAWDVFEHIPQVNKAFKAINRTLKKNGYLILTTPNTLSWDSKVSGKFWYGYKKIPEHLIFFSPHSIKRVLEVNGFKVIKIQTWGFVRDLRFIFLKLSLYWPLIGKIFSSIAEKLHIENFSFDLPLTDMIVVAKKINDK